MPVLPLERLPTAEICDATDPLVWVDDPRRVLGMILAQLTSLSAYVAGVQNWNVNSKTNFRQSCRRFDLVAILSILGVLMGSMAGCGRKTVSPKDASLVAETSTDTTLRDVDDWVAMETLGPEKWVAIEGASDVAWDDESHIMRIGVGNYLNGVRWTGAMPTVPYVVELEARRISGSDFFCGLTFPVRSGNEHVSLILGGWGGSLVGISSIDGLDASENSTALHYEFENRRWYRIRVEVDKERLQVWIDDRRVVDVYTEDRRLSLREGPIEVCAPFGIATWETCAELRDVKWRKLMVR